MSTEEMNTQIIDMLQGLVKRFDVVDERLQNVETQLKKKGTRKRQNPLAQFGKDLGSIQDVLTIDVNPTDNKIFIGLICDNNSEKAPVFSMTLKQFFDFMSIYKDAEDGEKVPLVDEAKFTRRYAKGLMGTWAMPDDL